MEPPQMQLCYHPLSFFKLLNSAPLTSRPPVTLPLPALLLITPSTVSTLSSSGRRAHPSSQGTVIHDRVSDENVSPVLLLLLLCFRALPVWLQSVPLPPHKTIRSAMGHNCRCVRLGGMLPSRRHNRAHNARSFLSTGLLPIVQSTRISR